jgi:hypothetical protein
VVVAKMEFGRLEANGTRVKVLKGSAAEGSVLAFLG